MTNVRVADFRSCLRLLGGETATFLVGGIHGGLKDEFPLKNAFLANVTYFRSYVAGYLFIYTYDPKYEYCWKRYVTDNFQTK